MGDPHDEPPPREDGDREARPPHDPSTPASWQGAAYAVAASHHRAFDDWFLDAHPPGHRDDIVDAGCGSGEFTARMAELAPEGTVVGVDADPSMLAAARRHHAPNLRFAHGTLQQLDRALPAASADLVVSRSVLHWLPLDDHLAAYRAIARVLRPGGWLHAESGGAGNLTRVREVLDEVAEEVGARPASVTFADAGVTLELLEQAGFEVPMGGATTVAQRRSFDPGSFRAFVRTQAAVAYGLTAGAPERLDRFVARVEERHQDLRRHDGSLDITFVRLHVLVRRPVDA